ncbi:Crp/Fnr family transcriptional regulator [Vallitalea okinawensis]|uniref:Crp/Fnr family transcriptional regulator n=1 Tax=Vallitalea okinawensis TaxID=2078660 RepID=UPI000CFD995F|nr:cyclic nucleotide-binding domain-containing protein [Vallitalea okinawensis]
MKRIMNQDLLKQYMNTCHLENIFDQDILEHAQLHFYPKNEFILKADFSLDFYYVIVDGKVKITYPLENGKSILLKFYNENNSLGNLELLKNIPICCNVEAIKDTYLVGIPSDILRKNYMDYPKFLHHLVDSLSEKLYATLNNSSYNLTYPLINRLCSYLVEYLTDKDYILLNSSFHEIAQFLGTTYRHLNRTFNELESKSIIKCENKTVYILDETRLRDLSKNIYMKSLY